MDEAIRRELDRINGDIMKLAAETAALQAVVVELAKRIGALDPTLANAIAKSFAEAANLAEGFTLAKGKAAADLAETLKIIRQMKMAVTGGN